jgi:tetratricopeptide (TPR) repeat protein
MIAPMPLLHALAAALALAAIGCSRAAPDPADAVLERIERARAAYAAPSDAELPGQHRSLAEAAALIELGRFDDARRLLEALASTPGHEHEARFGIALSLHKEERYAEARPLFEALLDAGPAFERAHMTLYFYAWCLYNLGEKDAARAAFEAFLALEPAEADAYFGLGLLALEANDPAGARTRFEESIQRAEAAKDPAQVAKACERLGDMHDAEGRPKEALDAYVRCLQLDPSTTAAYLKLSNLQLRLGDEQGAARNKKRYEQLLAETGGR